MPFSREAVALAALALPALASAQALTPKQIMDKVFETDAWGLGDAETTARATTKDARGASRELAFSARSRRYDGYLTKSIVRFTAPADIAGTGFLQVQKKGGDDERFLFLPELKKSRRIAGASRSNAFMSTDFSYGDLDRRDMREAKALARGEETVSKYACYKLELVPLGEGAVYRRMEIWVRKDNLVPLKTLMYNQAGVLVKTLVTEEVKRIGSRWYITRSLMTAHEDGRSTQLVLDKITPRSDLPDDDFTVRNLEKL
jgi:outer membrane lipoprotein-sorting protein